MLEEQAEAGQGCANEAIDKRKQMLDFLGEADQLIESQEEESLQDDYGIGDMLSSQKRRGSSVHNSIVSPNKFTNVN